MKRRSALLFALVIFLAPSFSHAAIVRVFTQLNGPASIETGQTTSITVLATVEGPLSPNDGIFTYDLDAIANNIIINSPSPVVFQSVNRPNVNDPLFTGSNGTPSPNGLSSIFGGYLDQNRGIGAPTQLFTAVLLGVSPGTANVTVGPSVVPFGFDFLLYQTPANDTDVVYDAGVTIEVTPGGPVIPLPPACAAGALGAACAFFRRRLRRRVARESCC